jgi:hypothetical protein
MDAAVTTARALGAGRAALGLAIVAAPDLVTPRWVGADGATPAGRVLARGLGARDVALGVGTAVAPTGAGRGWVLGGVIADVTDAAAVALAPEIPRGGRVGTLALAVGSAAVGVALLACLD